MIRFKNATSLSLLVSLLIIGGMIAGCDNTLEPIDQRRGFYSLYGALDMDNEVNYIRVKDLNVPLRKGSGEELDAEVRLTNLDRQVTEVLEDSVRLLEGIYTHNFRATMDIRQGERYRVEVESPEGETTAATAEAPVRTDTEMEPKVPDCFTNFQLVFDRIRNPDNIVISVGFEFRDEIFSENFRPVEREGSDEVVVLLRLKRMLDNQLFDAGYNAYCHHLSSDSLYVEYTHHGPDFYEQIETDTLDIRDGAGRFGIKYEGAARFPVDTVNVCEPFCPPFRRECFPNCEPSSN